MRALATKRINTGSFISWVSKVVTLLNARRSERNAHVLWERGRYASGETPVDIWRRWTSGEVTGAPVAAGHLMMEEKPDEVAQQLLPFLQLHTA